MDVEETNALTRVLHAFYNYETNAHKEIINPRRLKWQSLTSAEQELIPWFPDHLNALSSFIRQNGGFTRDLSISVAGDWGVSPDPSNWATSYHSDYEKVKSILKQIYREWSEDCQSERDISTQRFINHLDSKYPNVQDRPNVKILVPGAGLGRLNFELVKRGYTVQGNEYSYFMLLASSYILNHSYTKHHHSIYPFIHNFSHQVSRRLQTRPVFIPDVHSGSELSKFQQEFPSISVGELMSIASGSFIDLYGSDDIAYSLHYSNDPEAKLFRESNKDSFDVIITNFFLDTSSNVIEYLKTINHSLKPNGEWLNFGPLLWHYEDDQDVYEIVNDHHTGEKLKTTNQGLELSRDDLLDLISNWFVLDKHESGVESGYSEDLKNLANWTYKCEFWIAKKK